jgi:alkylation response protein AidB-like acyl-CoA dehydrogenase
VRTRIVDAWLRPDERAFRHEVAQFLAEGAGERDRFQIFKDRGGATHDLYQRLGARGWLSLTWPAAQGGSERPVMWEFLLWDEMAHARAARPPVGAGLVARTILDHGTTTQHDMFLPGARTARDGFALGYSEPEAGSDLTALRTRARRDGDRYIVTGEKRWTSDAHTARWLWLLCRTGEQGDRGHGLTLLVVDLASPGVSITPIPTLDGHRLNEVRLDDVEVPLEHRIGDEGSAWPMIRDALARERHLQMMPGRVERDLEALVAALEARPCGIGPDAEAVADFTARALALHANVVRSIRAAGTGEVPAVDAARNKVIGGALMQEIARHGVRAGGREAVVEGADLELLWRESIMETIAGGTTETMLTIVARHNATGLDR